MVEENYKEIPGYPNYKVSDLGNVKSLLGKGRILRPSRDRGRLKVRLSKDGKVKTFNVHQLVAIAFLNHVPCGNSIVVNHKNHHKADNRLINLQLLTAEENCRSHAKSKKKTHH
tara:strand:- start:542 stop:883 length:342 start_codon:yes stop_codon:yes gene_type:complete